jgi:hypothetical protein
MRSYKCCLLLLLLLLSAGSATSLAAESRFPIVVSGGAHSLTVPWHPGPVARRLNPALIAGTERPLKAYRHWRIYQTANLGFFYHYWWMTGVFLETELGVGRDITRGFHADLRLGAGYLHYFWRRKTLELKDGKYVEATNWGRPSARLPLTLVLGYRGVSPRPLRLAPFVAAQWAVQTPFVDESPAMTHFLLLVGVRINWAGATSTVER